MAKMKCENINHQGVTNPVSYGPGTTKISLGNLLWKMVALWTTKQYTKCLIYWNVPYSDYFNSKPTAILFIDFHTGIKSWLTKNPDLK